MNECKLECNYFLLFLFFVVLLKSIISQFRINEVHRSINQPTCDDQYNSNLKGKFKVV